MDDSLIIKLLKSEDPLERQRGETAIVEEHYRWLRDWICTKFHLDQQEAGGIANTAIYNTIRRIISGVDPPRNLGGYLLAAARNGALRHIERQPQAITLKESVLSKNDVEDGGNDPEEEAKRRDLNEAIRTALSALKERERLALDLIRDGIDGLDFARALGVKPANARQIRRRVKARGRQLVRPVLERLRPDLLEKADEPE